MAQVTSHAKDSASESEQLQTLNLSLKSIDGYERQLFTNIDNEISNNNARISAVAQQNVILQNYVRNLTRACRQLIQLEYQFYKAQNREPDFRRLAQSYGYAMAGVNL